MKMKTALLNEYEERATCRQLTAIELVLILFVLQAAVEMFGD